MKSEIKKSNLPGYEKFIVYMMNTWLSPNARYKHDLFNYYDEIIRNQYYGITSNQLESLNRRLKMAFPNEFITWKKTVTILRDFHLKCMSDWYFGRYKPNRLVKQRPKIRN